MEYYCQVWAGAPSCYLELLDKLQKWISRTVGPSLATSHESLAHRRNVASLSLFYVDVHLNWLNWLHFLIISYSTRYSDRLHGFSVTIPRCYKYVYRMLFLKYKHVHIFANFLEYFAKVY